MKNTTVIELVSQYIVNMQEICSIPVNYDGLTDITYYVIDFKHGKGSKRYKWNIINDLDPSWANRFCKTLMYCGCGYQLIPTDQIVLIQFVWMDNAEFRYVQNITFESNYDSILKGRNQKGTDGSAKLVWTITNVGDLMCVNT